MKAITCSSRRILLHCCWFLLVFCSSLTPATAATTTLSLAGAWRFELDRQDTGIEQRWFARALPDLVTLPGTLSAQGIGDEVALDTQWIGGIVDQSFFTAPEYEAYRQPGNIKLPFWLQPEKYYAGAAWYQRIIEIPRTWTGKRIVLALERAHWETRVWIDERFVGSDASLSTPHEYDLGQLEAGPHTLTVRVDNRMVVDIGENSHSVSDHTQGNWNGLVGRMELRATPRVWIESLQIYPHLAESAVEVKGRIGNSTGAAGSGTLLLHLALAGKGSAKKIPQSVPVSWGIEGGQFTAKLPIRQPIEHWDEFNPKLYELKAILGQEALSRTFGFREITTQGTQFLINGRPTFFRGTLDCCIYPKTGHPPTDVASWKKVISTAKAHGLNHIRFHSWCPPEAAFMAADALGFYFHVEAASWANQSSSLGDGKPVDQWIYDETDRILKAYGNHPSFVLMAYGNEPGGARHRAYLTQYVNHYKAKDTRRLWTSGAGWPQLPENQWHCAPNPRIQAWGQGLKSRINARPPETVTDYRDYIESYNVPVISHEIGQWCVYPNFEEIKKYTGYLKPKNFEIFRDRLEQHHMLDQAKQFLLASGKLQTLCYKEDIESALRTPGMGGFQLLDLHDFPGQGTALVGILDPFWEEKGYVTPAQFSQFCNSTVPLARLAKRVFTTSERLEADIELAHFGPAPLGETVVWWKLVGEGQSKADGAFSLPLVPVKNGIPVGQISVDLRQLTAPLHYQLAVGVQATEFKNDWDIWIYPSRADTPISASLKVVDQLNDESLEALNAGGKVLLLAPPNRVKADPKRGNVALGFSSIFWNTAWTRGQAPHTLGILCDPKHPLLAEFPTEYHSNWQWWYLVSRAGAMILDDLPPQLRPTVQVIDDWFTARKLGLVFEAKVGQGKLMVCSIDLEHELDTNPVARQFRHSLLRYLNSPQFNPEHRVTADQVRGLFAEPSAMEKHGARVLHSSSAEKGYEAENAIDGDPNTLWHTAWTGSVPAFPHEIVIAFKEAIEVSGFTVLPRQDNNRNGWIKDYAFYVSADGKSWGDPAAKGAFAGNAQLKTIELATSKSGRYVRLVTFSGHAKGPWASLAELSINGK